MQYAEKLSRKHRKAVYFINICIEMLGIREMIYFVFINQFYSLFYLSITPGLHDVKRNVNFKVHFAG